MSLYAIGDVHGSAKALEQALERAPCDPTDDFIFLGDVVDGGPETYEAIETLLDLPNLHAVRGNHDSWALDWMATGVEKRIWVTQGGQATLDSYAEHGGAPNSHASFLHTMSRYYEEGGRVFTHGGIPVAQYDRWRTITVDDFAWDRTMLKSARYAENTGHRFDLPDDVDKVFVGHTSTLALHSDTDPRLYDGKVWNLDTGAGYGGKVTVMRVEDEEYWQSDDGRELYPDHDWRG